MRAAPPGARFDRHRCPIRVPACSPRAPASGRSTVLDVIYVAATIALFALVALIAKGVERL
jgi:hypothetical protein